jgi:NAD(P)-dependent dehydrogenase (short-subunit alcohol dehydrogenase family)
MAGRAALVTGGAQGIGEGVARRLLGEGVRQLALVDRNGARLEETAGSLRAQGADVLAIAAELASVAACRGAVRRTIETFGRIDILANCAGNTERGGVLDTGEALFERSMAVNLRAPFFLVQEAAKEMRKRKSGVIINIASMLAYGGPPHIAIYSIAKAALVTLTKTAANTLKRDGIRVYAINLGWAVTPQEHALQTGFHGMPEDWAERIGEKQPFGRLILPEDVGGLCAFLVSKDASMMTGNIIDLEQFVAGTMDAHPAMAD